MTKRNIGITLILFLIITFLMTIHGATRGKPLEVVIEVDDEELDFEENEGNPYIVGSDVLIPSRQIFEKLGYDVDWSRETWFSGNQKIFISKDWDWIMLEVGRSMANINGKEVPLFVKNTENTEEYKVSLEKGRTYIPLSFIEEHIDSDVQIKDVKNIRYVKFTSK